MFKILIFTILILAGCTKKGDPQKASDPVVEGRRVYSTHCIACHGANPKIDGAVGPAVAGSSLELLTERVLKGKYPAGYTPKRETSAMAALPFLKDDIPALHAYLNSP